MITFLPSPTFTVCAKALDPVRLISQVHETAILLRAILAGDKVGQPAYDMWRPYPGHLAIYGAVMAGEFNIRFGTNHADRSLFLAHLPDWFFNEQVFDKKRDPAWLGDRRLHLSHIRRLFEKDPNYYAKWADIGKHPYVACCVGCNYWWPTHAGVV